MKKNNISRGRALGIAFGITIISLAIISGTVSASNAGKVPVIINFKDAVYDNDTQMVKEYKMQQSALMGFWAQAMMLI